MRRRVTLDVGDQRRWPASILITKVDREVLKNINPPKDDGPGGDGPGGGGGGGGVVPGYIAVGGPNAIYEVAIDFKTHGHSAGFTLGIQDGKKVFVVIGQYQDPNDSYNYHWSWVLQAPVIYPPYVNNEIYGGELDPDTIYTLTMGVSGSTMYATINGVTRSYSPAYDWVSETSPTYNWELRDWSGLYIQGVGAADSPNRLEIYNITGNGSIIDDFERTDALEWGVPSMGGQNGWYHNFYGDLIWEVDGSKGLIESDYDFDGSAAVLEFPDSFVTTTVPAAYYGQLYSGVYVATADGLTAQWTLPYPNSYVAGTLNVTVNGISQPVNNVDPTNGVFSLQYTPMDGDEVWASWTVPNSTATPPPTAPPPIPTPAGVPVIDASYGTTFRKVFTDGSFSPFQILTYPDAHIGEGGQYMTVFTRFSNGASQISIHNGYLDLRCVRQSSGTLWNGSFVGTSFDGNDTGHTYGYGIFRFWCRFNAGPGTWQSGWLYDTTNWSAIEIDWPEMLENQNLVAHVLGPGAGSDGAALPSDIATVFHCFKIERRSTFVAFSIDEVEVGRVTDSMPSDPLAILLDSKVGFGWMGASGQITSLTPNPAYFHVAAVTVDP